MTRLHKKDKNLDQNMKEEKIAISIFSAEAARQNF